MIFYIKNPLRIDALPAEGILVEEQAVERPDALAEAEVPAAQDVLIKVHYQESVQKKAGSQEARTAHAEAGGQEARAAHAEAEDQEARATHAEAGSQEARAAHVEAGSQEARAARVEAEGQEARAVQEEAEDQDQLASQDPAGHSVLQEKEDFGTMAICRN